MENREIKFRAWDEGNKVMHFDFEFIRSGVEGNDWIVFKSDKQAADFNHPNPYFSQQLKIMQFIGLLDKNKTEIYEGDIVAEDVETEYGKSIIKHEVTFNEGAFYPVCMQPSTTFQVTGNIFDNESILNIQPHSKK